MGLRTIGAAALVRPTPPRGGQEAPHGRRGIWSIMRPTALTSERRTTARFHTQRRTTFQHNGRSGDLNHHNVRETAAKLAPRSMSAEPRRSALEALDPPGRESVWMSFFRASPAEVWAV